MTPIIDENKAMAETMEAYSDLRRGIGTEQYKHFVEWIECLIAQHQAAMTTCAPDKLANKQVRVKQLISMRSALVDPGGAFTGYTFE